MKLKYRLIAYPIMFIVYYYGAGLLASLQNMFDFGFHFLTYKLGFILINIFISFIVLKWSVLLNLICSIIIGLLSLAIALKIADSILFDKDPYGIYTAIISNALLSIIFWEITCNLKLFIRKNAATK